MMYEKIKLFFKEHVAIIGGSLLSIVSFVLGRRSVKESTNRSLERLRADNKELENQLNSMGDRLREFESLNEQNRLEVDELRDELRQAREIITRSEQGHSRNESDLDRLEQANNKLRAIIEKL